MSIKHYLWKSILIYLLIAVNASQRENLARRHPCNPVNRRLEPYIKWTEKLANTQYKVQKDACGQTGPGPACCTNEIFNSYAISLGTDLKTLFDAELDQLTQLFSMSNREIDSWTKEYVKEFRHTTMSSLETLFGKEEYHANIHHSLSNLFNTLVNHQSTDTEVSKSTVNLFNQLITSTYRQFMTNDHDIVLDDQLKKCLINKAYEIQAFPTERELLYTLTSAVSLIHILRTLFIYMEADIQRLKTTATLNSHQCLQRYVRETLCPICVTTPSSLSLSMNFNNANEPLCENDCRFVIKTCFNETNNPYIAFAMIAQGYSNVTKQIQESVEELKLVERLSRLHIYLYDMVVNVTNTRQTYIKLQHACPNSNGKSFSPILSLTPISSEPRERVTKWNISLHSMLDQLQSSIDNLNLTLTQQIITDICSNSNYAVKSNRCTQIDQHTPGDITQWPLPPVTSSSQITFDLNSESTQNQLDDLKKKITLIQDIIISLRPRKKFSYKDVLPEFDYENDIDLNDSYIQSAPLTIMEDENDNQESLSERLYKEIDGQTTRRSPIKSTELPDDEEDANHSQLITYNVTSYLFVFIILIIHRISFTNILNTII